MNPAIVSLPRPYASHKMDAPLSWNSEHGFIAGIGKRSVNELGTADTATR
jgi:hypothetical protein